MLIEKLRADKMTAFKNKDQFKKDLLSTLIAEACKQDKEPNDASVISTIKKFIHNLDFTLAIPTISDEKEKSLKQEIRVLESYLPVQMTEDEVRNEIAFVLERGLNTVQLIMGWFKTKYDGQYDGKMVSRIVKDILE